jgi:hypothetical protein
MNTFHPLRTPPCRAEASERRRNSALFACFLFAVSTSSAADRIDGFTHLLPGDTLQMRFTSEGCFHFYTDELTFTRTNQAAVSITAIRLELDPKTNKVREAEHRELGKLNLSTTDLARLDAWLAYYRTNQAGRCTTVDNIRISQIHDGKTVATERFADASCESGSLKGVLTIEALLYRLPKIKDEESLNRLK